MAPVTLHKAWCRDGRGTVNEETWPLIFEELEIKFKKPRQHTGNRKSTWTGYAWWTRGITGPRREAVDGWGGLIAGWTRVRSPRRRSPRATLTLLLACVLREIKKLPLASSERERPFTYC